MKAKLIRSETEYEQVLTYIEGLMDAAPGSPEEEDLELFSILIERYENENYPIDLPDPVEAIKFRMEQEGLTRKDMREFLGSQSKVSEILNRKRSLSLSMIRSLHEGLGIPAEVLLKEPGKNLGEKKYSLEEYPFTEMFNRGYFPWFRGTLHSAKEKSEELLEKLFSVFPEGQPEPIYCKNSDQIVDENALFAWQACVTQLALEEDLQIFSWETLKKDFFLEVVKLSFLETGPRLAKEFLNKQGIHLIIEKHLPKTYLDGASFLSPAGNPIIALTLRYDREDNFWFTLIHEMAHTYLHLKDHKEATFFDDTNRFGEHSDSPPENEANKFTKDLLISPEKWNEIAGSNIGTIQEKEIVIIANDLRISPAIVAGRVRWETGEFRKFSSLVGNKNIREQFSEYSH